MKEDAQYEQTDSFNRQRLQELRILANELGIDTRDMTEQEIQQAIETHQE